MASPSKTFDEVLRSGLATYRTSFPGYPLGLKKFLGRSARANALLIWQLHKAIERVWFDIVPTSDTSTEALQALAVVLGLTDGQGGYGPLKPTTSSGGAATLTGVKGTVYPDATTATAEDGTTEIALSGAVTIPGVAPGFGSVAGVFVSTTTGTVANLPEGTVCTWTSPPVGADSTFTLTSGLSGAIDTESDADLLLRITARLQNPPKGGAEADYLEWALVTGVIKVYLYPLRSGTGTVDMVIAASGSGVDRKPGSTTAAVAAVELARPVTVNGFTVYLPYMPGASGHIARARVVPSATKYNFDWDDTGTFTVDTFTAGSPATLKLNTLAPATLKAAIDAGSKPRLQVLVTGGPVIPVPVRCTAWVDGGGKTTLTLENPLPDGVWAPAVAPTAGDVVYAYGPVCDSLGAAMLAVCDSLGPSRVSGYGDVVSPWVDKLTISALIAACEGCRDTDGTKLIFEVIVGGATIDGAVADIQGIDHTTNGPELLYLKHAVATQ